MMYEEITASCLIKIDVDGNILAKPDFGALNYGINKAGYVIHSALHAARPELACVIHTHNWASMAVSALECGLLPITQTSMRFLRVGYHDYQGVVLDTEEQASLLQDLVDARALALLPPGAHLINVARGEVVVQADLIQALQAGRLAGAHLNVFDPEPLPEDSPLWALPNVLLTPHAAGHSDGNEARVAAMFLDNLARWCAGRHLQRLAT